jgi:hypothetical protein
MTIQDLGVYGGSPRWADINDAGQVAITADTAGYVWQNGAATQIDGIWALAINGSGDVLETQPGQGVAIWNGGTTRQLPVVGPVGTGDINDHDTVVGTDTLGQTFVWTGDSPQIITAWNLYGNALGVNDSDQVVGTYDPGQTQTAFEWQNGVLTDLPSLPTSCGYGPGQATAYAINDSGVIVGTSIGSTSNCVNSAVVWRNGSVTELPRLDEASNHYYARDINEAGVIVGNEGAGNINDPRQSQATQWVNGQIQALPGLSGLNSIAYAINSGGVVAGYADDAAGVWHAVLWQPSWPTDQSQTISFGPLPNATYGQAPVSLVATASSGLPVTFTASGSCTVAGATLSIVGAGSCTVTANQAGSTAWLPAAPVSQSFSISQASLQVTPDNLTKVVKAANPPLTTKISGFVNGETLATSGVAGAPACSTTATTSSGVGTYQNNCSRGTLAAANYGFTFGTGSLKVVYGFKGFLQPINDTTHSTCGPTCSMSVFKAGSVVPVSFKLYDAGNHEIKSNSLPVWVTPVKVGTTTQKVNECVSTAKASTGSTYKLDVSTYYYNWSTKGLAAGSVYKLSATLDDGTVQTVLIGLN